MSILGAVRLAPHAEFFARYENAKQDTDLDGNDFISAGINFSLSKLHGGPFASERITLGYSMLETPAGDKEHLAVLQWNLVLHSP